MPEDVEDELLLDTFPDILGEAKANTLSDTLVDGNAQTHTVATLPEAKTETLAQTLSDENTKGLVKTLDTWRCKG